jgi:hypothetical protein
MKLNRTQLAVLATLAAALFLILRITLTSPPTPPNTQTTINTSALPEPSSSTALWPIAPGQVATAARTAQRFIAAYGTYRYNETPDDYLNRLADLADDTLLNDIGVGARDPATLTQRRQDKAVATATAAVTTITDVTPTAITFTVTGHQHLTTMTDGTTTSSDDDQTFTVQVALRHGTWQVHAAGTHNETPP